MIWKFRTYVSGGVDQIQAAYDAEQKQARAKFVSRLKMLSLLPYEEWAKGGILAKDLRGDCSGLREIRFQADKLQQRPLGFRSGEFEFVILFWAHEKGGKWLEKTACQQALARKEEVLSDIAENTNELWLALQ